MRNFYIIIQKSNKEKTHFRSFVERVTNCDNLILTLHAINNLYAANICATKKEADRIAEQFNADMQQQNMLLDVEYDLHGGHTCNN